MFACAVCGCIYTFPPDSLSILRIESELDALKGLSSLRISTCPNQCKTFVVGLEKETDGYSIFTRRVHKEDSLKDQIDVVKTVFVDMNDQV